MYVAGRASWKISIDEPQVLRIALYLRDLYRLAPETTPVIPALDPSAASWPVWARRPPDVNPVVLSDAEQVTASAEWARWWGHALEVGAPALQDLVAPSFRAFQRVPVLRRLLARHHHHAWVWSTAFMDDPRVKRDHHAPGARLTTLVAALEREAGRPARTFDLRITVIAVEGKHAWRLGPDHLLVTHHLIRDDEIMLDWLRSELLRLV